MKHYSTLFLIFLLLALSCDDLPSPDEDFRLMNQIHTDQLNNKLVKYTSGDRALLKKYLDEYDGDYVKALAALHSMKYEDIVKNNRENIEKYQFKSTHVTFKELLEQTMAIKINTTKKRLSTLPEYNPSPPGGISTDDNKIIIQYRETDDATIPYNPVNEKLRTCQD